MNKALAGVSRTPSDGTLPETVAGEGAQMDGAPGRDWPSRPVAGEDGLKESATGTVITLHYRPFLDDLWPQLDLVPMVEDGDASVAHCARLLEIFLDRVSLLTATTTRHLLDQNFEGTFSRPVGRLRRGLASCGRGP